MSSQPVPDLEAVLEELHADHERLRMRVLDLMRLMEDEVTDRVEAEQQASEWEQQATALQRELDALRNTKLMRAAAPLRRIYTRVLGRD